MRKNKAAQQRISTLQYNHLQAHQLAHNFCG